MLDRDLDRDLTQGGDRLPRAVQEAPKHRADQGGRQLKKRPNTGLTRAAGSCCGASTGGRRQEYTGRAPSSWYWNFDQVLDRASSLGGIVAGTPAEARVRRSRIQ